MCDHLKVDGELYICALDGEHCPWGEDTEGARAECRLYKDDGKVKEGVSW